MWREEIRQRSPNFYVGNLSFNNKKQVSNTNSFLSEYATGQTELVKFKNEAGRELSGVLLYPDNYDVSKKYPMIVYAYELLSSQMHYWKSPSERSYYNFTRWTHESYFVLLPDIHFRHGDPGVSLLDWNGGSPEVDHWETGQARMGVPYWEDKDAHRRNSPIERVDSMTPPLLLAHGNKDRVVEYFQSTVLYNFARRAGKQVVFLTYEDEDHSFQKPANQIDYHRRLLEWFGHYLKGEPAADWITKVIPYGSLESEKRRLKEKK